MSKISRILFRDLLALGRLFDRQPYLKAYLVNPVPRSSSWRDTDRENLPLVEKNVNDYAKAFFMRSTAKYYHPTVNFTNTILHFYKENRHLQGQALDAGIESAFIALRQLNNAASSVQRLIEPSQLDTPNVLDVNIIRASKVEPGVILLAHPAVQKYNRSMLMVLSHDNRQQYTARTTTRGVFLTNSFNKTPDLSEEVNDVYTFYQQPKEANAYLKGAGPIIQLGTQIFVDPLNRGDYEKQIRSFNQVPANVKKINRRNYGGPFPYNNGATALFNSNVLHTEARDKGLIKVLDHLYWTPDKRSMLALDTYIEEGKVLEENCILFDGLMEWKAQQLQKELDYNIWIMIKCDDIFSLINQTQNNRDAIYDIVMKKLGGEFSSWQMLRPKEEKRIETRQ